MRVSVFVRTVSVGALVASALLSGCAVSAPNLQSAYPFSRARAAVDAGEANDKQAIFDLVNLLEDPDRGVRMLSILSLERLTGKTFGYRYWASEALRSESVDRWRDALREGRVEVGDSSSTDNGG